MNIWQKKKKKKRKKEEEEKQLHVAYHMKKCSYQNILSLVSKFNKWEICLKNNQIPSSIICIMHTFQFLRIVTSNHDFNLKYFRKNIAS